MAIDTSMFPEKDGTFQTSATNLQDFWRDLYDHVGSRRREEGRAPASFGASTPTQRDTISTWDDVVASVGNLDREAKQKQGGFAVDTPLTQPDIAYGQQRYDFLAGLEGERTRVYDDETGETIVPGKRAKGKVTVGVGFNMDAPGNREQFKKVLNVGDDDFEAVYSGSKPITAVQSRKLFDATIREAEDLVKREFDGVDLTNHQRLALVSLAFNSPALIGPRLKQLVREGRMAEARDEILYGSGEESGKGVASRRYREAGMFVGPMQTSALPDFKEYLKGIA